jgi:hypothetical protein
MNDSRSRAELPLLLLVTLTILGYAHFTWQNPYYVCVKGSYLLGLSVPFAYYASEPLADWTRDRSLRSGAVGAALAALFLTVAITFSYGLVFKKRETSGLPWRDLSAPVADHDTRGPGYSPATSTLADG